VLRFTARSHRWVRPIGLAVALFLLKAAPEGRRPFENRCLKARRAMLVASRRGSATVSDGLPTTHLRRVTDETSHFQVEIFPWRQKRLDEKIKSGNMKARNTHCDTAQD